MSKLTYMRLSLTGPRDALIDNFNELLADFLWSGKSPEFRREISKAEFRDAALKLHNIKTFDTVIKIFKELKQMDCLTQIF